MTNPKEIAPTAVVRPESSESSTGSCSKSTTSKKSKKSKKSRKSREKRGVVSDQLRIVDTAPRRFKGDLVPLNNLEQKERFLKFGFTPQFQLKGAPADVERIIKNQIGHIKFNFFNEARRILDSAVKKFKCLDNFVESNYGPPLTLEQATEKVMDYIRDHKLENSMDVIFCGDLACSAQMSSTGMDPRANRPELRRYTLLVKSSSENIFLREKGIICLMDHEIGTHYFRSYNDGFQPWYSCRDKFGLCNVKTYENIKTEEGLACVHTLINSNHKLLTMPALLYYASCMAEYLTFRQLFDHLGKYVKNEEQRWKHCMRVKRGLKSVNDPGGYGKDQRYFEGAVEILRRVDEIDFGVLMCGKITWEELPRVKRLARPGSIRLPNFMRELEAYKKQLKQVAKVNGLLKPAEKKMVSMSRVEMLHEIRKMDICRELPVFDGPCCYVSPAEVGGDGCGCLLFTRSDKKLKRQSKTPHSIASPAGKQPVPILFEIETSLPILRLPGDTGSTACMTTTGCA